LVSIRRHRSERPEESRLDEPKLIGDTLNAVGGGWSASGWEILTPAGSYGQEFMVHPAHRAIFFAASIGRLCRLVIVAVKK
jgi:hypothetical protein